MDSQTAIKLIEIEAIILQRRKGWIDDEHALNWIDEVMISNENDLPSGITVDKIKKEFSKYFNVG